MEQAFYNENKERLLEILLKEHPGSIEYQFDKDENGKLLWDQVAVWFEGFALCYQDSDMNGEGKGEPHWNNPGANSGLEELRDILLQDERFMKLHAVGETWEFLYIDELINDFCELYAEENNIKDLFEVNEEN